MRVLAIASAILNIALAIALYRENIEASEGPRRELHLGDRVPALSGSDPAGRPRSIEYPAAFDTVLYAFSPDCGWCRKNESSVEALARALRGKFRFIGVSLDRRGLFDWMMLQQPEYDVLTDLPYRAFLAYRFESTPTTIVISREGIVKKIWHGTYRGATLKDVEAYFGVLLPRAS